MANVVYAEGGFFEDDTDGELLYGYVEYARPSYGVNLKLGRQHVFEGVANENVDGLRVAGAITPYFVYSAYGGLPVAFDSENGRDGEEDPREEEVFRIGGELAERLEENVCDAHHEKEGDYQEPVVTAAVH